MPMNVEFVVQSVNVVPVSVTAQHEGQEVRAVIQGCEIQFVSANGVHGSFTARFTGSEAAEAVERMRPGQVVVWSI